MPGPSTFRIILTTRRPVCSTWHPLRQAVCLRVCTNHSRYRHLVDGKREKKSSYHRRVAGNSWPACNFESTKLFWSIMSLGSGNVDAGQRRCRGNASYHRTYGTNKTYTTSPLRGEKVMPESVPPSRFHPCTFHGPAPSSRSYKSYSVLYVPYVL